MEEQAELLVGLIEGVDQGLEPSKVADQLVHAEYSHHLNMISRF